MREDKDNCYIPTEWVDILGARALVLAVTLVGFLEEKETFSFEELCGLNRSSRRSFPKAMRELVEKKIAQEQSPGVWRLTIPQPGGEVIRYITRAVD